MQIEHDKEIDALLRKIAGSSGQSAETAAHLDADQISMFAENAMPEAGRASAIVHLADCDRCRTILSGVIEMNSDDVQVEVAAPVAVETAVETVIEAETGSSWLSRLFATRNLALGFGALALFFVGFLGITFIANFRSGGGELAKADEADMTAARTQQQTVNSNIAAIGSETSADEEFRTAESAVQEKKEPSKDGVAVIPDTETQTGRDMPAPARTPRSDGFADAKRDVEPSADIAEPADDREAQTVEEDNVSPAVADKMQPRPEPEAAPAPPAVAGQRSVITPRGGVTLRKKEGAETERANKAAKVGATGAEQKQREKDKAEAVSRKVSGKTFTQRNGAWYDTAYKNQATTSVRRGTDGYRNLDAGLRTIGETLSGTIYVVWKSKAFKIQ